jgi:hypothetical protein
MRSLPHLRYRTSSAWTRELIDQQIEEGKLWAAYASFNVKEALHSRVWMWMTSAQDSAVELSSVGAVTQGTCVCVLIRPL